MEIQILDYIQRLQTNPGDIILKGITMLGDGGIVWIVLALVLLFFRKTRKAGIVMAVALIINALTCNLVLKPLVARPRPFDANPAVSLLVKKPHDYSFPSGHTSASFACTSSIFMYGVKKYWIPPLVLSCLIAFSRMYLYVHYPTDILGGIAVGILSALASWCIFKKVWKNEMI